MDLFKVISQGKQYIKKEWKKEPKVMQRTLQSTAKQFLILFFLAMFGLSFLSRAADSVMTAKVTVMSPKSSRLNFKINGAGTIKEKEITAIKLIQGLMIEKTFVSEGEGIKEGDSLFSYDMEDLQRLYDEKEAALEKNKIEQKKLALNNTESELKSAQIVQKYAEQSVDEANENLDAARQSIDDEIEEAYNTAREEYEKALQDKESAVTGAKEKLEEAKAILKELQTKQSASDTTDDSSDSDENISDTITTAQIEEAKKAVEIEKENLASVKNTWKETVSQNKSILQETKEKWDAVGNGSYDYTAELSSANSALTAAQRSLEEAELLVESAAKNQSNAKETAALTSDSIQLDIDLANQEVEELKSLINSEGIVSAPVEGAVVSMEVKEGAEITGGEAVSLAVDGVSLEIEVEKEAAKGLTVGDSIQIKAGDSKERIEGELKSIGTEEKDGMLTCEVDVPNGDYTIGENVTFEWSKESEQYDKCISINALREDGFQQTYVLVIRSKESILGNELQAYRMDVTVIKKDTNTVAVEGSLAYDDQIIIGSNKEIAAGDRIRVDADE